MNRLRRFVDKETQRLSLSDTDSAELLSLLLRALKNKKLNSKTTVVYDIDSEEIKEIKGLVYHTTADGRVKSELLEKKGAVTFRRRGGQGGASAANADSITGAT
jgi:hypothetical protein